MPVFLKSIWLGRDISRPLQVVINQYVITIMGGREVSRPYRAFTTLRFVGRHR